MLSVTVAVSMARHAVYIWPGTSCVPVWAPPGELRIGLQEPIRSPWEQRRLLPRTFHAEPIRAGAPRDLASRGRQLEVGVSV